MQVVFQTDTEPQTGAQRNQVFFVHVMVQRLSQITQHVWSLIWKKAGSSLEADGLLKNYP